MLITKIKEIAAKNADWVKDIRHQLHSNPELSFQEFETSKFIINKLQEIGLEIETGYVKTGIVATLKCKNPESKTIALRADMDALPITETNEVTYKSKNIGVMHACGHDVHSSSLIGVAKILNEIKDEIEGTIKFIFQPGEEKLPGGASLMLKEGLLTKHPSSKIFAQHVTPQIEIGKVGFKSGMFMASTDEIYIEVVGVGGHAAMEALYNNPLIIASELLIKLNEIFSIENLKKIGIETPTVLAFGKIIGEGATNVIPDKVNIEGTFRTFDEDWRKAAHQKIKEICEIVSKENKATININIIIGYPFLVNDKEVTEYAKKSAMEYLGKENVIDLDYRMTAEDFAFFSQQVPSCFYRIGTGNIKKNIISNVHTSTFNIDEESLEIMTGLMSYIAINELCNKT
jgi:amidohydrolase